MHRSKMAAGDLVNLGASTIYILSSIGIVSREQLEARGAIETYNDIRRRGIKTSKVLLYALHAAIRNQRWQELSHNEKQSLVQQADALMRQSEITH